MRFKIGIWAGGDPTNGEGTITWAGGATDYSKAPFSMSLQAVNIVNYSPAKSYSFLDNSGAYTKIGLDGGSLMSNADGAAKAPTSTGTGTTMLSLATAIPTNIVGSTNKTTNATATGTQTKVPGTIQTSSSGSKPANTTAAGGASSNGAVATFNSIPLAGVSTVAFGAVAFFMALFV
jgi:hypothetical protein